MKPSLFECEDSTKVKKLCIKIFMNQKAVELQGKFTDTGPDNETHVENLNDYV